MSPVITKAVNRFQSKTSNLWYEMKDKKVCYLLLAPFAIFFFVFTILPVMLAIGLSFTYYNMLEAPEWIGWGNYVRLFLADDVFITAVQNTFVFASITGPVSYFACLVFAWMINELQPKIRAFLTLLFYAPSLSGSAFMIFRIMFDGDSVGYVNAHLLYWGLIDEPIQFFLDPQWMMPLIIMVVLWMSLGTSFLVFIAGLQGIDESLYEAGAVDGIRNRWQELWYLTLPAIIPHMMFGAIMSITQSFSAAARIIPLVGFPSTDYAARTVVTHLLDYGNIRFEMGYAAAIATILFLAMVTAQKIIQRMLGSLKQEGGAV